MLPNIIIVLLVVLLILYLYKTDKEHYGEGALIQLMAKGPQDTYLTGDAWQHMYYPYFDPYYSYVHGFRSPYPYYRHGRAWYNPGVRPRKSQNILF